MLHFFRKYQRVFFIFLTIIIIASFSFFGTYGAMNTPTTHNETAFYDRKGKAIKKYDLDLMAHFLITDAGDKINYGGAWGPNFLNDGVIAKDFLQTGLAEVVFDHDRESCKEDFTSRQAKEKAFRPYEHPQTKFLSAKNTWNYFAPNIPSLMETLSSIQDPSSQEAFQARSKLYLAEKEFPAFALRRMLQYQRQQYQWIPEDPNLAYADLNLYGYRHLEDWFGYDFIRTLCKVIINSSHIAEERGYKVSRDEALADMIRNATQSYEILAKAGFPVPNSPSEYFDEQLRRMGVDRTKAVNMWTKVLLFRRLFHDYGDVIITDALTEKAIHEHTSEYVGGNLYHLPDSLKFARFKDMQRFETYLDLVAKRASKGLDVPSTFLSTSEVAKNAPELVQRRYLVEVKEADKSRLETRVGIKEMWTWQGEDANWKLLEKQFPELAVKGATNSGQRLAILDQLDANTRAKIDRVSRQAIVEKHPEWLAEALDQAESKKIVLAVRQKGGTLPLQGVTDMKKLTAYLNQPKGNFTEDGTHVYTINVLERGHQDEVLTFAEAREDGTLDRLLEAKLDIDYQKAKQDEPSKYKNGDGSFKSIKEVSDEVAKITFKETLKSIRAAYPDEKNMTDDYAASRRLGKHMQSLYKQVTTKGDESFVKASEEIKEGSLAKRLPLENQWKLMKTPYRIQRSQETKPAISVKEAFALSEGQWSKVKAPVNGDLAFFQLEEKGAVVDNEKVAALVNETHQELSAEAQRHLMRELIGQLL